MYLCCRIWCFISHFIQTKKLRVEQQQWSYEATPERARRPADRVDRDLDRHRTYKADTYVCIYKYICVHTHTCIIVIVIIVVVVVVLFVVVLLVLVLLVLLILVLIVMILIVPPRRLCRPWPRPASPGRPQQNFLYPSLSLYIYIYIEREMYIYIYIYMYYISLSLYIYIYIYVYIYIYICIHMYRERYTCYSSQGTLRFGTSMLVKS